MPYKKTDAQKITIEHNNEKRGIVVSIKNLINQIIIITIVKFYILIILQYYLTISLCRALRLKLVDYLNHSEYLKKNLNIIVISPSLTVINIFNI